MRTPEQRDADSYREANPIEYILTTLVQKKITGDHIDIRLFDLYNGLTELRTLKGKGKRHE